MKSYSCRLACLRSPGWVTLRPKAEELRLIVERFSFARSKAGLEGLPEILVGVLPGGSPPLLEVRRGQLLLPVSPRIDSLFSGLKDIGHEIDFYIDQDVVDGLKLRLVGAYLFAGDAYTYLPDDDNAWEAGARLQWSF